MTEVFCAGRHAKVPSERSHRQYTAEVCRSFRSFSLKGLATLGRKECVLTTDPTMHCRSNSRANTNLRSFHDNWQSEVFFFLFEGELCYRSGLQHHRKIKKRRVTLWHNCVCYCWFLSHMSAVSCFFLFFLPFGNIRSVQSCAQLKKWRHMLTHLLEEFFFLLYTPSKCPSWRIKSSNRWWSRSVIE